MKISDVPQDDIKTTHGEERDVYAVDDQEHYTQTTTRGWEVEDIVLKQVISDFEEKAVEEDSGSCMRPFSRRQYNSMDLHIWKRQRG